MRKLTPLGKCLRKIRIDLGVNQRDMAIHLGISVGFLSKVGSGSVRISDQMIERLERYRSSIESYGGRSLDNIVTMSQNRVVIPMHGLSDEKREIVSMLEIFIDALDETQVKQILGILRS